MKKNKAQEIIFYPADSTTPEFVPQPIPASRHLPEWYKKQPATIDADMLAKGVATSTVKKCMPIFDAITSGYLFLAPCDIYVDATNPEKLEFSVPNQMGPARAKIFSSHAIEQYSYYPINPDRYHKTLLRIFPLWAAKTPDGYSSMITPPLHSDDSPILAFSGVVDTDKFVTDGHFSFLVEKDFKGVIKKGTPLVQLTPFKRESWQMSIGSTEDAEKILTRQRLQLRSFFANAYKTAFRSKKDYK